MVERTRVYLYFTVGLYITDVVAGVNCRTRLIDSTEERMNEFYRIKVKTLNSYVIYQGTCGSFERGRGKIIHERFLKTSLINTSIKSTVNR